MSLLGGLMRRSVEDPTLPLTATSLADWLAGGRTKAGALVSEERVHGIPAYLRALTIRASVEAALPLKLYKRGTRERITRRTVLDRPNPAQTPFQFWQTMRMNGIGHGNMYAHLVRDGADVVKRMTPVQARRVRVEPVEESDRFPDGKLFIVRDRHGAEHRFSSWTMLHIPYMAPDGSVGISAFKAYRESLGTAIAAEDVAGRLFANGNRLSGVLSVKDSLDDLNASRLKRRWRELFGGAEHAGDIAVLDNSAEFKAVMISPQDAQLLSSRQWSVTEIARMVGVLPHMIGDTERSTSWGTGIEHQFIGWVQTIVYPELVNIEQSVPAVLPGGLDYSNEFAEYTLEGFLRGDSAARQSFYAAAIQWGWMTRNEVRVRENLEPLDGLDEPLTPSNMTLISIDGTPIPLSQGDSNATTAS
jgi:HK97 family phage portal protein